MNNARLYCLQESGCVLSVQFICELMGSYMTIQEMLRALGMSGLSQSEIGELTGVSQPTICRALGGADVKYETGKKIERLYQDRFSKKKAA